MQLFDAEIQVCEHLRLAVRALRESDDIVVAEAALRREKALMAELERLRAPMGNALELEALGSGKNGEVKRECGKRAA